MEINNLNDLSRAAEEAGVLLQKIQNYCEENDLNWIECSEAKVRFPRGFIRTAGLQRNRLTFVADISLRSNLAYTLILSDVVLWLQLRTDLWGTPKEMLTKLYVFLIGSLCESITKEYLEGVCGHGYKKRNEFLVTQGIISEELKIELDWLWDTRNKMHLFQLESPEYENDYNHDCHMRCIRAFRGLIASFRHHGRPQQNAV